MNKASSSAAAPLSNSSPARDGQLSTITREQQAQVRSALRDASAVCHAPRPTDPQTESMPFRVDLDIFRGPVDLLLYLVRKHEVDIQNIPVAKITEQYLEYLTVLEHLDVNAVGDFLEMASLLVEIKSKLVLPVTDEDENDLAPLDDPREELVSQLLQYKQYKDAASILEERGRSWSNCFSRLANDLPQRNVDPAEQPIHEVELWDLVSALGRVIKANEIAQPKAIVYDDTPIQVYMENIHQKIRDDGQVAFSDMFQVGMHKSALIGVFLAVLELVRHHQVHAEQDAPHGEIYLLAGEAFGSEIDLSEVDEYDGGPLETAQEDETAQDEPESSDSLNKPR